MCFQPFKSSIRIYRTFFKGINGNSGGGKEKQGVGREIFTSSVHGIRPKCRATQILQHKLKDNDRVNRNVCYRKDEYLLLIIALQPKSKINRAEEGK
jgi:hypothetical protein